jgi:hypothetical protein
MQQDRMSQMKVRGGRIETRFDSERFSPLELPQQLIFEKNLHRPST